MPVAETRRGDLYYGILRVDCKTVGSFGCLIGEFFNRVAFRSRSTDEVQPQPAHRG